jgi:hypothetical protein
MTTRELSPGTLSRLTILFPESDRATASRMLADECGNNLPFLEDADPIELERVRFAALKLSGGELARLRDAVNLAKTDWRDLLIASGFADDPRAHEWWQPA